MPKVMEYQLKVISRFPTPFLQFSTPRLCGSNPLILTPWPLQEWLEMVFKLPRTLNDPLGTALSIRATIIKRVDKVIACLAYAAPAGCLTIMLLKDQPRGWNFTAREVAALIHRSFNNRGRTIEVPLLDVFLEKPETKESPQN